MIVVQLPAEIYNAMIAVVEARPAKEVFDLLTAILQHKVVADTDLAKPLPEALVSVE